MTADGPALFSDDTAVEVRDAYREALEHGATDEEAEQLILREFADSLADDDEAFVVWLALAYTQSRLGRLSDAVHAQALSRLDAGGDLHLWEEVGPRSVRQRAAHLAKIRTQLVGPQPSRKRIRQPTRKVTDLVPGNVLGYQAPSGRFYLMRVAEMYDSRDQLAPFIRFLDYAEPEPPNQAEIDGVPDREIGSWLLPPVELLIIGGRPQDRNINLIGTLTNERVGRQMHGWEAASWSDVADYLDRRDEDT
jgi:hypothetical protein